MKEGKGTRKLLWVFFAILLAGLLIFNFALVPLASYLEIEPVEYDKFISLLDNNDIRNVHIQEGSNVLTYKVGGDLKVYSTTFDRESDLVARLEAKGLLSEEDFSEKRDVLSVVLFNWALPILAFVAVGLIVFCPRIVGQESEQLFGVVKTKWFWLYFVMAAATSALCVFLLPIWKDTKVFFNNWSEGAVQIILALLVAAYILMYLVRGLFSEDLPRTRALLAVKIAEICALGVLVILCIIQQFGFVGFLSFVGPCFVVGCVLYLRGLVEGIKGYLYTHRKKESYSLLQLIFCFFALTLGTILIVRPYKGEGFMWLISIAVWIGTALLIVWGILSIPEKAAKPEVAPEAKPAEPAPKAKPKATPETAPEAKPTEPAPKAKPKATPETAPEAKPAEPAPKAKPKAKPETAPEAKPAEPAPKAKPKATPETAPEAKPTEPAPKAKPKAKPEVAPEAKPAEPAPKAKPKAKPETAPEAKPADEAGK